MVKTKKIKKRNKNKTKKKYKMIKPKKKGEKYFFKNNPEFKPN